NDKQIAAIEKAVGYRFSSRALIETAMTHSSALAPSRRIKHSYQRLEFLGDRVLGLAVAGMLYKRMPNANEGDLSRTLNSLVRKETCARVSRALGLGKLIRLGDAEARQGGADKDAILGDVCEAVIGAIYLDGGIDPAYGFIEANFGSG